MSTTKPCPNPDCENGRVHYHIGGNYFNGVALWEDEPCEVCHGSGVVSVEEPNLGKEVHFKCDKHGLKVERCCELATGINDISVEEKVQVEHAIDCENIIKERDATVRELIDALERCRFYAEDRNSDAVIHIVKIVAQKWENPAWLNQPRFSAVTDEPKSSTPSSPK